MLGETFLKPTRSDNETCLSGRLTKCQLDLFGLQSQLHYYFAVRTPAVSSTHRMLTGAQMSDQDIKEELVDPEFTHSTVPSDQRKSFFTVAGTWFGYPTSITNTVIGGIFVGYLGFQQGLVAMAAGAFILMFYVGVLSFSAAKYGMNFPQQAQNSFGTYGYIIVVCLLATTGIGWFAVQTGLTGESIYLATGINATLMSAVGGILYIVLTYIGVRAIGIIGWLSAPFFIVLSIVAIIFALKDNTFATIWNYTPPRQPGVDVFSLGVAVAIMFGTFTDAGGMTADVTRWAKSGRQAFWAQATAFPFGHFIGALVGGVVVTTGVIKNTAQDGGNIMAILTGRSGLLSAALFLFVLINLGASCTHCLYNGSITWSRILGKRVHIVLIAIGILGTLVAVLGIWSMFENWLNFLGIFIPPVGAVLIVDQLIFRKGLDRNVPKFRVAPFVTWAVAAGLALYVDLVRPWLSYAVIGFVAALVLYSIIALIQKRMLVTATS